MDWDLVDSHDLLIGFDISDYDGVAALHLVLMRLNLLLETTKISRCIIWLSCSLDTKELDLHRDLVEALSEEMRLAPVSSWLQHDILASPLEVDVKGDTRLLIKLEEGSWLILLQWSWVLLPLGLPCTIVLGCVLVEWLSHLKCFQVVRHENETSAYWVSSTSRCQERSDGDAVNSHQMTMQVSEVKLWPRVIARKDMVVIHDDRVDLVRDIVLSALVLVDYQREEF